ncbi:MAG: membrane protein insertase YidC, partial [Candidatus Caldarchaeum sp.]
MRTNYIAFFLLSLLIIIISSVLFAPTEKPPAPTSPQNGAVKSPSPLSKQALPGAPAEDAISAGVSALGKRGETLTVSTPLYIASIDTMGGRVTSWELKGFRSSTAKDSGFVNVLHDTPGAPYMQPIVEGVEIPDPIPFSYDGSPDVNIESGTGEIVLTWQSPEGIAVKKTLSFRADSYLLEQKLEVENRGAQGLEGAVVVNWYANMAPIKKESEYNRQFLALIDSKVERKTKRPTEAVELKGTTSWFGFSDKYFVAAFLPEVGAPATIALAPANSGDLVGLRFSYPASLFPAGGSTVTMSKMFLGPMELELLRAAGEGLEQAINYGWVGFLARPMLTLLKGINGWFGNYGLSIIAITLIIRLLFLPLTLKSMESMKAMQEKLQALKPKIDEIKKKYKGDKARENQELMQLYTSHGINPLASLGGCLPLLIQIPVFIALYEVLLYSIELRHSSFLWVDNLAEPEHLFNIPGVGVPFRILPLVMGASWYLSQKLTPSTPGMEGPQAKIMEFMPIIFTILFWGLPSGLILYWTVSNIL